MDDAKRFKSPPQEGCVKIDPDIINVFRTPQRDGCKRSNYPPITIDSFRTPQGDNRKRSRGTSTGTPTALVIPASPFMQKLGYGTGVNVYLMKSSMVAGQEMHTTDIVRATVVDSFHDLSCSGQIREAAHARSPKGHHQSPWAVKKLNRICDQSQQAIYQKRLREEANILKNLQHPNIIGYRAFTEANDGSLCLAMEYGGDTSLNDLIEAKSENGEGPFPAETILKVALNLARGLKYLHNEKKLLHGDIKSSNVVIKGDFEAIKVCDVGVSLPLDENMTVSNPNAHYIGTEPWKPKESLEDNGVITDKSDIFAFGLTLWEMMTLAIPHINLPTEEEDDESFNEDDFDDDAYYEALGTRPALNIEELGESYQKVIELFSVCTNEDPKRRPSAAHIVAVLEAEYESIP